MHDRISVILPCYRNPDYLALCLDSAISNQTEPQEIMVAIDGYPEETKSVVDMYRKHIRVLEFEKNHGMQYAINAAVMQATSEWIFVINDDNVFPREWDKRLLPHLTRNHILTVQQIEPTGPGMFNFPVVNCGARIEEFDRRRFEDVEWEQFSLPKLAFTPEGGRIFPFAMEKWWFMAAGGFDTFYKSPNICDWDFFLKLEMNPLLHFGRLHTLALYHFGSVITKKGPEAGAFSAKQNYAAKQYEYKWGIPPRNVPDSNSKLTGDHVRGIRLHPREH